MNENDKSKLKVLIKKILLEKSPNRLTSNQLANNINKHEWGFRSPITSPKISSLMKYELSKHDKHFLDSVVSTKKRNGTVVYYIPSKTGK